jgi:hypothetical protein
MKKLLLSTLAVAALSLASLSSQAAVPAPKTVTGNFVVSVSLDPVCKVTTDNPTLAFGTYVAFGGALTSSTGNIVIDCTRNLSTPTVVVDAPVGVVAGLQYTVQTPAVTNPVAGATPTISALGTAAQYNIALKADMPGNQAGECSPAGNSVSPGCTSVKTVAHTVTITY